MQTIEISLRNLFYRCFGEVVQQVEPMQAGGSYRRYFRLISNHYRCVACWNADKKENAAFVSFARSFYEAHHPVPRLYAVDETNDLYLQEDLGSTTLFELVQRDWLPIAGTNEAFPETLKQWYAMSLRALLPMQLQGKDIIDYSKATPAASFHRDAIHWDLNYFKYFFLRLMRVPFDEQALEDDFRRLSAFLLEAPCEFFLFRDFQSANIMIHQGKPYFIDFQGGRRGALPYDVASLLFDAKACLPKQVREELLEVYLQTLSEQSTIDAAVFMDYYQAYVLCRLMQAMGAFGLRGVVEHKPGFAESIPPAIAMMRDLLDDWCLPCRLPELQSCLHRMQTLV